MIEGWLQAAAGGMERLRWLVLRNFGVLPGDAAALRMTDEDYVHCGLQLLLDARQRTHAREEEAGGNPGFDRARFESLGGGV